MPQSLVTLHAENGQTAILARFGQAEEHRPQHALCGRADGQQHLCKRQDIKRYATQQDDDARAKRESLQPTLDVVNKFHFQVSDV